MRFRGSVGSPRSSRHSTGFCTSVRVLRPFNEDYHDARGHERISAKLAKFQPSLTLALQGLVAARRAQGLPVYDFGLGEAKGVLDPSIRDAGERAFREEATMYSEPAGTRELPEAVLRWLDVDER